MKPRGDTTNGLRRWATGLMTALALAGTLAVARTAAAEEMPKTAADHQALIQTYRDRAAAFRKEAAEHKAMATEYRQGEKAFDATGHARTWALRLATAHEKMAKEAERMAADAEQVAGYHEKLATMMK